MKSPLLFDTMSYDLKKLLLLALPVIFSCLVQNASPFIATDMIAHLGLIDLSASILVSSIFSAFLVFILGLLSAISVTVSQAKGAQNSREILLAAHEGLFLSVVISSIIFFLLQLSSHFIYLSGAHTTVILLAEHYLVRYAWAIFPLTILIALEQIVLGLGCTLLLLFISLVEVMLEIISCYLFSFGAFGIKGYGLNGIAYGFIVGFSLTAGLLFLILLFKRPYRDYQFYRLFYCTGFRHLSELVRIGAPVGLTYFLELVCYLCLTFMISHFGVAPLAAHQIVLQYASIAYAIVWGLSQAMTVNVGELVGQKKPYMLRKITMLGAGIGLILMSPVMILFYVTPTLLISVDLNLSAHVNYLTIHYAILFFMFLGIILLLDLVRFVFSGALKGMRDTKVSFIFRVISFFCIGLPLAYFLAFVLHYAAIGIWAGLLIGLFCGTLGNIFRFYDLSR